MAEDVRVNQRLDIRGEVCPMTFVRSKLALESLGLGDVLEIVLDHAPAAVSVPKSFECQGHAVLAVERSGEAEWRLLVRKGPGRTRG